MNQKTQRAALSNALFTCLTIRMELLQYLSFRNDLQFQQGGCYAALWHRSSRCSSQRISPLSEPEGFQDTIRSFLNIGKFKLFDDARLAAFYAGANDQLEEFVVVIDGIIHQ
jgi:hypothetical protein